MSSPDTGRGVPATAPTVAVMDAGAGIGSRLVDALRAAPARRRGVGAIVAIDPAATHEGWRRGDLADPRVVDALAGVETVVWVAVDTDLDHYLATRSRRRRADTVRRAQTLVTAAAAAGVRHVVVVTSAVVYGAHPDNPVPLPDDAPLRAPRDDGQAGDLLAVEDVLDEARHVHPGLVITSVRPAALVGPGVDTVVSRHFEAPRLLVVRGARPAWQFCHVDDLASALAVVVVDRLAPVVTVGSPGTMSQADVERLSGMRRVELSETVALGTAQRLHRIGVLPSSASELAVVVHPWAVSTEHLQGRWEAAYDNETALQVLLDSVAGRHAVAARRVERKDAALGGASAAVALVATAALLRRARRT